MNRALRALPPAHQRDALVAQGYFVPPMKGDVRKFVTEADRSIQPITGPLISVQANHLPPDVRAKLPIAAKTILCTHHWWVAVWSNNESCAAPGHLQKLYWDLHVEATVS